MIGAIIYLACDQGAYDRVYKALVQNTLEAPLTPGAIKERNDAIELLRKLCRGQKSSWEEIK